MQLFSILGLAFRNWMERRREKRRYKRLYKFGISSFSEHMTEVEKELNLQPLAAPKRTQERKDQTQLQIVKKQAAS